MEMYINEHGKQCYKDVTVDDKFCGTLFHIPDWQPQGKGEFSLAFHSNLGSLTVLRRKTGYTGSPLDTESGFRSVDGKFWLASGSMDVNASGAKTVGEAIEWVKANANTCIGE